MRGVSRRAAEEGAAAFPPRPALPPVLACALSLWASCAAVLAASGSWDAGACLAVGAAGIVASVACAFALWRLPVPIAWAALLGAALGIALAGGCAAAQHEAQLQGDGLSGRWRFEVAADGSQGPYGATCFARANLPDIGAVTVRLRFEEGEDPPRYGDVLEADATLSAPGGSSAAYCWRQGAVLEGTARRVVSCERADALGILTGLRNRAIDLIADEGTDDGAAVLAALVCGWRGALEVGDAYAAYQTSGLAHLVAVSGAHLSIVAGCAAALLRALRVPRRAGAVLQASFLLGFLVLAAAPSSAVRAAVMAFAGMFAFTARRRPAALSALAVCMIGCIALDPRTALAVSFALSALSTLGIVLFAGFCQAWIARCLPRAPRLAREALALTAASSLAATPLAASLFSQLPLVAPLANMAAAPLFPLVCAGGLVAVLGGVAVPAAAPPLIGLASVAAAALTAVVRALASVPHASVPAAVPLAAALATSTACATGLWLAWPRPSRRLALAAAAAGACALAAVVAVGPRLAGDEIVMLDVGQGDAFVVRSRGAAVLIDTGNQERLLREALARHSVYRLDAVVITHGDDDHKGSLACACGIVDVRRVQDALSLGCAWRVSLVADACKLAGDGSRQASRHHAMGSFDLQTKSVARRFSDEGQRRQPVPCRRCGHRRRFVVTLFTGDAERDQLRDRRRLVPVSRRWSDDDLCA